MLQTRGLKSAISEGKRQHGAVIAWEGYKGPMALKKTHESSEPYGSNKKWQLQRLQVAERSLAAGNAVEAPLNGLRSWGESAESALKLTQLSSGLLQWARGG